MVFFSAVVTVLFVSLLLFRRQEPADAYLKRQWQLEKKWRELAYTEIREGDEFARELKGIRFTTNCAVSDVQLSGLHEAIYNLAVCFKTGSYEAYRRFRTPVPARLNPVLLNLRRQAESARLRPGEKLPEDPEEFIKLYISRWNGGKGFTNCWLGVATSEASVIVEQVSSTTNGLMAFADRFENMGTFRPNPQFLFDVTPEKVLERDGKLTCATASMVIKHASPDPPYLEHIRWFWDEKGQVWIPWEFVSAYSGSRTWRLIW
jgi:hypothetical protein